MHPPCVTQGGDIVGLACLVGFLAAMCVKGIALEIEAALGGGGGGH